MEITATARVVEETFFTFSAWEMEPFTKAGQIKETRVRNESSKFTLERLRFLKIRSIQPDVNLDFRGKIWIGRRNLRVVGLWPGLEVMGTYKDACEAS